MDRWLPDPSASANASGYCERAPGALQFTVAAGTTPSTLLLHASAKYATARLDVSLSDGSMPVSMTYDATGGLQHLLYTIAFSAASPNQTLTVTWTDTGDVLGRDAYAALFSAALK